MELDLIQAIIARGDIAQGLDLLVAVEDGDLRNRIIALKFRCARSSRDELRGCITREEAGVEQVRVVQAALGLIQELRDRRGVASTPPVDEPMAASLARFLTLAFSAEELDRFIRSDHATRELADEVPAHHGIAAADFAFAVASALDRRGLVDNNLFSRLHRARPAKAPEIAALSTRLAR